ncbi:MAG: CDGSH iron-sulfur domain-containing protein [Coriobacteriales bacterium]|nr:CDGSH iron-sulfur domain-containing protein [Coriobacteriales bacterium]
MSIRPQQNITVSKDGPYLVQGGVTLTDKVMTSAGHCREYRDGAALQQSEEYALCRCGSTETAPFCDGHHVDVGFDGTETAGRLPYLQRAEVLEGPTLDLLDDNRCAFARFCHRADSEVWTLTERSDDPDLRTEALHAAADCPAGRLVHRDKINGYSEVEPAFDPEVSSLQDPERGVSGPLYVRGGVGLVSSDETAYEQRNRYALCRCGNSHNKPFCDAAHIGAGYLDGIAHEE